MRTFQVTIPLRIEIIDDTETLTNEQVRDLAREYGELAASLHNDRKGLHLLNGVRLYTRGAVLDNRIEVKRI